MRFEKNLNDYKTTNQIMNASDYLYDAIEKMLPRLEKIYGLMVLHDKSKVSFFSNYIKFYDEETYETLYEIRISDHMNNELNNFDDKRESNIWINGEYWKDVKKEIMQKCQNRFIKGGIN